MLLATGIHFEQAFICDVILKWDKMSSCLFTIRCLKIIEAEEEEEEEAVQTVSTPPELYPVESGGLFGTHLNTCEDHRLSL